MKLYFTIICVLTKLVGSQKSSPCPEIFTYEPRGHEDDRWYGVISLRTPEDLTGVWLKITLDKPAELIGNWFGEASSSDNIEYIIRNTKYKLEAGPPVSVRFFVKYNTSRTVPSIETITLNGRTICTVHKSESELRPTTPMLHISQLRPTPSYNSQSRPSSSEEDREYSSSKRPGTSSSSSSNNSDRRQSSGNSNNGNSNSYKPNSNGASRPSSSSSSSSRPNSSSGSSRPSSSSSNSGTSSQSSSSNSNRGTSSSSRPSSSTSGRPSGSSNSNSNNRPSSSGRPNNNNNERPSYNSQFEEEESRPSNNNYDRPSNTNLGGSQGQGLSNSDNIYFVDRPSSSHSGDSSSVDENEDSESDFFAGDFANILSPAQNRPASNSNQVSSRSSKCGIVAARANPLISHGQETWPGQWPWHAALYHSKGIQLMYTCGATLITEQHVVTAAHCVTKPHTNRAVNPSNILVYLGKYNLITFGPEVQDRGVLDIHIHPEYNHSVYFNDIAVLKLTKPITITNFVRPCCLWDGDSNLENIIRQEGVVVGWGFDENRKLTSKLMQAKMPVISTVDCIYSNRDFFSQFTFEKNYCAGFRNGTSVCNGDSGGGMVFPKRGTSGQNTVWQLRGLVSVGVALQGQGVCDPSQYIVFTDVAKQTHWIRQVIAY